VSSLSIENLRVSYAGRDGTVVALDGYSLDVAEGSLTVLLGESGCGKSTALNAIAGLLQPDAGRISLGDQTLFDRRPGTRHITTAPNHRDIGMVFQSYALWPHLSVLENVMYPARRRGADRAAAASAALEVLKTVRCDVLADRYPGELSGGQQQRIALARAMVARPKVLLFDEPLSNLDAGLRRGLRDELARLHRQLGFTGVYVTHDQSEALALGTELAVMDGGKIVQLGSPENIYEQPVSEFVARFFGANVISGHLLPPGRLDTLAGSFEYHGNTPVGPVVVAFMPHAASIEAAPDGKLHVSAAMYLGSHWEVRLDGANEEVLVEQPAALPPPAPGTRVRLRIAPDKVHAYTPRPT
jgi:ABC-type Fe3+/spermidine/putrescine transport system ATPase subunit